MYEKTEWIDGQTPVSAENMNKIETALADNEKETAKKLTKPQVDANEGQILTADGTGTATWKDAPQPTVDKTLTKANQAADAKAVGDALNSKAEKTALEAKLTAPTTAGTSGQLLSVDADGNTVWKNAPTGINTQPAIADLAAAADAATIVTTVNQLLVALRAGKIISAS